MRLLVASLVAGLLWLSLPGAGVSAAPRYKVLGTDPSGDAPPALDLTALLVGRTGQRLEVRIAVEDMLPVVGGYESIPAIAWIFDAGDRTFAVEAYIELGQPRFLLFEYADGEFHDLGEAEGTYDWTDGYVAWFVPLETIHGGRGTVISGADEFTGRDANSHIHYELGDYEPDVLATTKSYRMP